jgi:hypothetical protein
MVYIGILYSSLVEFFIACMKNSGFVEGHLKLRMFEGVGHGSDVGGRSLPHPILRDW